MRKVVENFKINFKIGKIREFIRMKLITFDYSFDLAPVVCQRPNDIPV